jgi:hypothetical protein
MPSDPILADDQDTHYVVDQVLKRSELKPEAHDLVIRTIKATAHTLINLLDDLDKIKGLQSAEGSEVIALIAQEALAHDLLISKRTRLKLKGSMAFKAQLEEAGGVYSAKKVAELLGISSGAIRKRVERNNLLAVMLGGQLQFPIWQFTEAGVVDHFTEILGILGPVSAVSAIQFFLTYDEDLRDTPIGALQRGDRSQLETIRLLAKQWQQQVAR